MMLLLGAVLSAQSLSVKGTVRDSKGEPVVGAVLILQGSSATAAMTDMEGRYSITVPSPKSVIKVSCISYKEQEINVSGRALIDITLADDSEVLDEVVVVGYGAMRRSDLTGSVASIKIDDDNASKSSTLDQMLEGRAAGVQVLSDSGSPDAGVTIRIRGISSFSGATDPLYVVDGVIIGGESESIRTMSVGTSDNAVEETNGLSGINPSDIASIEILKDASATAIYGSQGANGVVLITTKQASKDIPVIHFNAGVSVSTNDRKLDILSFDEYCDMLAVYPDTKAQNRLANIWTDPFNRTGLLVQPKDWQDYIFRTAIGQRYYFSVSGRPKGYNYLFSLGFNRNEGIVLSSDSNNLSIRLNLDKQVTPKFKLSFKNSVGYTKSNIVTGSVNGGNVTSRSSLLRTILRSKPYLVDDGTDEEEDFDVNADDDVLFGPPRWINGTTNTSERIRINPSLSADYKIADWLTFKSTFGGEFNSNERIKTKVARLSLGYGNVAGSGESQRIRFNWDNLLMANFKWGGHTLSGTVGHTMSKVRNSSQSITGWFLPQAQAHELDINNATSDYSLLEAFAENESTLLSFFGRGIYNFKERYILTGTLRFDGSSKFQGANKWGVFPSFAFAWRITSEPWFHVPFISNAKLRLGWGQVGNQTISSYQTQSTYFSSTIGNHFNASGKETVLRTSNIRNKDLKWETSDQLNAGLDLSLWKGRLALTADVYRKDTKDLLQDKVIPMSTGFSTMAINDGTIRNDGIELTLDSVPLKFGDFEWGLGGNISFNRNTILNVGASGDSGKIYLSPDSATPSEVRFFYGSTLQSSGDTNPLNIFIEGQTMGLFYGYVVDGIIQEGETGPGFTEGEFRTEGYCLYRDLDNNGYIDTNDRTIIGNPLPKFTYGFNTSISWKGLTLKADFNGAYRFDIFNMNNIQDYENIYTKNMRRDAFLKAWTPENKSNEWPALGCGTDTRLSTRFVEDGTYLRLSSIALSYDFPFLKKSGFLHGLSLTASVSNLRIWTGYSGYNPANNSFGSNVKRMGVDLNSAPYPRSFNFDVKFTF